MKVLHLGKFCPPNEGGIELFSYDLLEYLNFKGIKADLLCFDYNNKNSNYRLFDYYGCKMNIKLNSAPISYNYLKNFFKIAEEYDIIHSHVPNPLADFLSLFTNKKLIIHWHSDIVKQKIFYKFYKPLQQKALKKANKIICASPQYLESSLQLKEVQKKAVIIPLGLGIKRLKADSTDKAFNKISNIVKDKKIILALGRLVEYKGFEYLVEAGKYIREDAIIFIAGGGPLYNKLIDKVKSLNLEKKVYILGRVDNIKPFMELCDIFCLPSITKNEAFGLVLVEALYFGKPLVTTDVEGSGMSYVNQNGVTGLVVPPRDPKNAYERFKEFEISNIGDKVINLYKEVLNC
ncbi:glycosyltransferase [Desulfurella sp.]|uniref:glycosyltransferase n=1 Tax=Desulfurella sp. TaxID=1962857 RepID=UPI0025BC4732|nr:glycosyltransferase [Desulfurella sp.]